MFQILNLLSEKNGLAGVVLPRSSLYAKGSAQFRRTLFKSIKYINLCLLENTKQWVFDIDPRYTICLTSFSKSSNNKEGLKIQGPFNSLSSFKEKNSDVANVFKMDEVFNWNDTVSIPLFPKTESAKVFAQLRKSPRLDLDIENEWRVRAIQEMNMTFDSDKLDYSENCPKDFWKVYKGASFDLWNPDTGEYNAFANPKKVLPWLQEKRLRANLSSRDSIHKEFPEEFIKDIGTLSANSARLVFRDITNRTNTRTVIACLIPPKTFITNTGPVIIFSRGDQKDEAYLLGVLSSIPLDWYARRFVETHLNFFILNPLPIPRPNRDNIYWQKIVEISGRLACPDERFRDWAEKVDVDYGPIIEEEKKEKIYEIDALVSHLYGLKEDEITHIYETFHSTWDYKNHLKKVLQYYKSYK